MKEYGVTEAKHFFLGKDQVTVEISDLSSGWHWRLKVNGEAGPWSATNFICLNGYAIISEYYEGPHIKPWVPFHVTYATEDKR